MDSKKREDVKEIFDLITKEKQKLKHLKLLEKEKQRLIIELEKLKDVRNSLKNNK
jgi:hypothetical protein